MSSQHLPRVRMAQATLSCILFIGAMTPAGADVVDTDETDQTRAHALDPVVVTVVAKALHESVPSQGSLVATQPQSIVGADFIQNNDAPAANYTDIIKFTPSVWTVDPNGPGLMENWDVHTRLSGRSVQRHLRRHSLGRLERFHASLNCHKDGMARTSPGNAEPTAARATPGRCADRRPQAERCVRAICRGSR